MSSKLLTWRSKLPTLNTASFRAPVQALKPSIRRYMGSKCNRLSSTKAAAGPGEVQILHDLHCNLGEAPTWDERTQTLYFVDINDQKIYGSAADGSGLWSIDTHETVGTIALTTDPNILLAAMNRSVFLVNIKERSIGGAIATVPAEHGVDEMRFNDGKASPGGVFLVGRMHLNFQDGEPGRFYRLHWESREKGHFEELKGVDEVGLPNGLAWDQEHLYHADTVHRTITAYQTDSDGVPLRKDTSSSIKGTIRVNVDKDDGGGPDGICISKAGNIWVALPMGGQLKAYSSKTGEEVNQISLPVNSPTACTFGGPNLETLYITSMKSGDDTEHWGSILAVQIPGESGMAPAYKAKLPDQ